MNSRLIGLLLSAGLLRRRRRHLAGLQSSPLLLKCVANHIMVTCLGIVKVISDSFLQNGKLGRIARPLGIRTLVPTVHLKKAWLLLHGIVICQERTEWYLFGGCHPLEFVVTERWPKHLD